MRMRVKEMIIGMNMIKNISLVALLSVILGGCSESGSSAPSNSVEGATVAHDHGSETHEHEEGSEANVPAYVYTDYTDRTELFVEFPALIVGEPSRFAAHLTDLQDASPLVEGMVDVVLRQSGRTVARYRVREVTRAGLFSPTVTPQSAGEFDLAIEVNNTQLQAVHNLGTVRVFSSLSDVVVPEAAVPEEGDISYLKEQQWTSPFATELAVHRNIRQSVPGFGTIESPSAGHADVRSPANAVVAIKDLVMVGETVRSGDVLARLLPRMGVAENVDQLRLELEQNRIAVQLAEAEADRIQRLVDSGALPQRRLEESNAKLNIANSELRYVQNRLEQTQLSDTDSGIEVRAPISGVVTGARTKGGSYVSEGQTLFSIVAGQERWLSVEVPEIYSSEITEISGFWAEIGGNPVQFDVGDNAYLIQAPDVIDVKSRTFKVVLAYNSQTSLGLLGQRLPIHLNGSVKQNSLVIPESAIVNEDGRQVVFVQVSGESFARRYVELGIQDGRYVEVVSGIQEAERVVTKGAYYVRLAGAGNTEIGHGHAH